MIMGRQDRVRMTQASPGEASKVSERPRKV